MKDPLDSEWLEEHYQKDQKREQRKERTHAQRSDRSQFKKTDQDQKKKQSQAQTKTGEELPLHSGRVLSITPDGIEVQIEDQFHLCTLRGVFKKTTDLQKNRLAVGDLVEVSCDKGSWIIENILPRSSILSRADNLSRKKEQILAANVDCILIMASVVEPSLKVSLIDRYLIAAKKGNLNPIVVINKADLLTNSSDPTVLQEQEKLDQITPVYQDLGIPFFLISTKTGEGIPLLQEHIQGKTSVISGQSGVGKTSLLSLLTGKAMRIGLVRRQTRKGTHTTTQATLIPLDCGGFCIDTPGIRSFGVWDLDKTEIEAFFPEIFELGHSCRFPDCRHIDEPDCAVKQGLDEDLIAPSRYLSYATLMQEIAEKHRKR